TGKTVTLMTLAAGCPRLLVPVFLPHVKGHDPGLAPAGTPPPNLQPRVGEIGIPDWAAAAAPMGFGELAGASGQPLRTTISEVGPLLLGRMLELNDTQSGVLDIVFKLADDRGLLLLDLADLRALLGLVAEERKAVSAAYGLVS